jgi:hypothetical protein
VNGKRVEVRCGQLRAIAAEITEAEIVADHENDVGTAVGFRPGRRMLCCRRRGQRSG